VEGDEMTSARKFTFIAAAVLGLGFGGYLGYSGADEVSSSLEFTQYLLPTAVVSDFARVQFKHADADHARQAVVLQIHLLEQLRLADKAFQADMELGKAYTRLALIEEAAGQPEAEQRALGQARASYKRAHSSSKEPTDDEMKRAITLMDSAADRL
jgi:hypothetical protein